MKLDTRLKLELMVKAHDKVHAQGNFRFKLSSRLRPLFSLRQLVE